MGAWPEGERYAGVRGRARPLRVGTAPLGRLWSGLHLRRLVALRSERLLGERSRRGTNATEKQKEREKAMLKMPPYEKIWENGAIDPATLPAPVREAIKTRFSDPAAAFYALRFDGLMGCWLIGWSGMTLGIESDGHIHS